MNRRIDLGPLLRLPYRLMLRYRTLASTPRCRTFAHHSHQRADRIQGIYVINLDRQQGRWHHMQRELGYLQDFDGRPLLSMTERFPAFDARHSAALPNPLEIDTSYTLGDQVFVEPQPFQGMPDIPTNDPIEMSSQEIAVASSHIAIWRLIATGSRSHVLVVEDDAYFRRNFAPALDQAWTNLFHTVGCPDTIDCLYLSYEEAKGGADRDHISEFLFRPRRGLWNLSGYVLSQNGAKKLLKLLPVSGPVDLWLNHQFAKLHVLATSRSLIEQRRDYRSDNSYSVLPVLSKLGILTRERPALFPQRRLISPVFGICTPNAGSSSLSMALSMLGYRCVSDLDQLPDFEYRNLLRGRRRIFDAYVSIGSLAKHYHRLLSLYPRAKVIVVMDDDVADIKPCSSNPHAEPRIESWFFDRDGHLQRPLELVRCLQQQSVDLLALSTGSSNDWQALCGFLQCDPPIGAYPTCSDQPQRRLLTGPEHAEAPTVYRRLRFDKSPWIVAWPRRWSGVPLEAITTGSLPGSSGHTSHSPAWRLLHETFPSNRAIFRPANFSISTDDTGILTLRKEEGYLREYTSASLCSHRSFQYGRFEAQIRPASIPGVITGMFLHRNSPRQEIDIEFLGRDTTKMLVNVFYNPGDDGARFDYGYRGTPMLIDLGFDASLDFHTYALDWSPTVLRWLVDGHVVHQRVNWKPTPVPHLPMRFYINLWPSRARQLAGRLADASLPAQSEVRSVNHGGTRWSWPERSPNTEHPVDESDI